MADCWNRFLDFEAGATFRRAADVGPADPAPGQAPLLGTVRVGVQGEAILPEWVARIQLPAQQLEVGPIDIPFVLAVELPVRVYVHPPLGGAADATMIVVSAVPGAIGNKSDGATYSLEVAGAAIVPVPQWVTTISCLSAGVLVDLLDTAGAVLDQVTGLRVPRPRECTDVRPATAAMIVFGYTN